MSRLVMALLAVCAGLAALTAGPVAAQDGALRERMRERLQRPRAGHPRRAERGPS